MPKIIQIQILTIEINDIVPNILATSMFSGDV